VHNRQHKEEVVKRKGFTLIELMVVIAIIIILAAIAIPNYLKMTERAKKSRVAADFGALALALESYKTDWGTYPVMTSTKFGRATDTSAAALTSEFGKEIGGQNTGTATASLPNATTPTSGSGSNTTATGEKAPIEYMKPGTLVSMANPFNPTWDYYYIGAINDWGLYAQAAASGAGSYLARSSTTTTIVECASAPTLSECSTGS
jgi:prepilin-type N-terminal cleavage/methylation domain-containing protein